MRCVILVCHRNTLCITIQFNNARGGGGEGGGGGFEEGGRGGADEVINCHVFKAKSMLHRQSKELQLLFIPCTLHVQGRIQRQKHNVKNIA